MSSNSLRVGSMRRRTRLVAGGTALVTAAFVASVALPAHGAEPTHASVVSIDPSNVTPNVNQGKVESMVQIGSRIVAVGKFTSVTAPASAGGANVHPQQHLRVRCGDWRDRHCLRAQRRHGGGQRGGRRR